MSSNTVAGHGGFFELENGEELFLTPKDIPEPPASTFTDNPYEAGSARFKRWRIAAKARYTKAMYKATVDAKNKEHFLSLVGSAKSLLQDSSSWDNYKSCRGMEEYKRPVGRPKLTDDEKIQRKLIPKRSDAMRALLLKNGIAVSEDGSLHSKDGLFFDWKFQINGRVRFENEDPISVHSFLSLI